MPKETITMPLEEDVLSIGKKLEKLVGQGQSVRTLVAIGLPI